MLYRGLREDSPDSDRGRGEDPRPPGGPGEGGPAPLDSEDSDLFDLLGNDVRLGILRELRAAEDGGALTFSGLRERVDVLQGDEDNFPVANAREIAAELPDAAVHVVDGADHSFVGGDPEEETVETTLGLLSRPVGER